ncbi:hypothetical protein LXL04_005807 [Taraxacum kok-saghyz]
MTPFQALYGRPVPTIHHYTTGQSAVASIDATLSEHQRLHTLLKETLKRTRQRMTDMANKKRLDKHFNPGELVFLKLHNYRQHSVEHRNSKKLSKRYFGPFPIIEKIGQVAYRLQLPAESKIHPVFHVSLLKQAFGNHPPCTKPLPSVVDQQYNPFYPEAILETRITTTGITEALVQWKNRDLAEATWESYEDLRQQFPTFRISDTQELEDELCSHQGGIDTGPDNQDSEAQQEPNARPKRTTRLPARFRE